MLLYIRSTIHLIGYFEIEGIARYAEKIKVPLEFRRINSRDFTHYGNQRTPPFELEIRKHELSVGINNLQVYIICKLKWQ